MKDKDNIKDISRDECVEYLNDLFLRSIRKSPFDVLCSLLRVGGWQDAGWDPFRESKDALEEFDRLLEEYDKKKSERCKWRIGLLMYCHAIEMSTPHELLANLFRCLSDSHYHIRPFEHLIKNNKKKPFSSIPPSATRKFNELKRTAKDIGESKITEIIDNIFNEDVRNSFSHSDYIITSEYFRWTEGGLAQQLSLETLDKIVSNCFAFYGALFWCHKRWIKELAKTRKYHKWERYEVLEILSNEDMGVYGFYVHFSNGNKATYTRTDEGTRAINIMFEKDGSINFQVGSLDDLESVWKIDGKPVKNWDELG